MIKPITKSDLKDCLKIFHQGYETVAIKFGLTEENYPDRGGACLPLQKPQADFEKGALMFGYFCNEKLVGFLGIKMHDNGICSSLTLLHSANTAITAAAKLCQPFARKPQKPLGAQSIIGQIEDNKRLRQWYENNGFVNAGYKNYKGAPYTVA